MRQTVNQKERRRKEAIHSQNGERYGDTWGGRERVAGGAVLRAHAKPFVTLLIKKSYSNHICREQTESGRGRGL